MKVAKHSTSPTELERFASWFHQDFALAFSNADEGAKEYFRSLTSVRRQVLATELEDFLKAWAGREGRGLRNAWIRLGAEWSARGSELRTHMQGWVRDLK
jgi:contact-dependent growth inhibition (CDI) system CdiI-like immunity protein